MSNRAALRPHIPSSGRTEFFVRNPVLLYAYYAAWQKWLSLHHGADCHMPIGWLAGQEEKCPFRKVQVLRLRASSISNEEGVRRHTYASNQASGGTPTPSPRRCRTWRATYCARPPHGHTVGPKASRLILVPTSSFLLVLRTKSCLLFCLR